MDKMNYLISIKTKGEFFMRRSSKMFKMVIGALCFLLIGLISSKSFANEPIKIGAIFSITGPAAFLGAPEAKTAEMLVEEINSKGGINGHKLELIIKDSAGSPEKAFSLAKQLIEEEQVFAIIGPSTSGESLKIKQLCNENKTLLISCAAAETIVVPVLPYVFKTPQSDKFAAMKIFETMKKMGLKKVGALSSSDGFGAAGKAQLEKIAPEYDIELVMNETYDKNETDLSALVSKLKGAGVDAVVNWSIVPAQSILAKNMKQLGLNVPLFQSHGFGNIKYVEAAGKAAEGIIFPCGRLLIADLLPDAHPQKELLMKYKKDYENKYKEPASTFGGHSYDAILIVSKVIEKSGADREKAVKSAEAIQGLVGTAGIFNMSEKDHNGLTIEAFEMLTVKDGAFVPLKE